MTQKRLILFLVFLLLALSVRFFLFFFNKAELKEGDLLIFNTRLNTEPKIKNDKQNFIVNYQGERIFITASKESDFHYGDKLKVEGKVSVSNFKDKLLNRNISLKTLKNSKVELVKNEKGERDANFVLAVALIIRQKVDYIYSSFLPYNSETLLSGIVFGIKKEMNPDFESDLKKAGLTHVVAASGMNVSMVSVFMLSLLTVFLRRQFALIVTMIAILFYCLISGFESSIIRASIMGGLVLLAQVLGRQATAIYSLFIAGIAMLFLAPETIFDIGFQLSFLATFGLVLINPFFMKVFPVKFLSEALSTTLSAQLATLPILLLNFGTFSLWSTVSNLLVLWTVPIIMVLGGLGFALGLVFKSFGAIFLFLSLPFLLYLEKVAHFFSVLPGSIVVNLNWQLVISYYLFLTTFILLIRRRLG